MCAFVLAKNQMIDTDLQVSNSNHCLRSCGIEILLLRYWAGNNLY
jgi:hypothetical protein